MTKSVNMPWKVVVNERVVAEFYDKVDAENYIMNHGLKNVAIIVEVSNVW